MFSHVSEWITPLSRIGIAGRVEIQEHDARTGQLIRTIRTHNLMVNTGLAFLIDRAKGDTSSIANYFAVGTAVNPPAATDTLLAAEVFRTQIATSRRIGLNQWEVKGFVASGQANGHTLVEFGIFASSDTNGMPMLCRLIHGPITKNTSSTITYIWTGTFTAL